MSDQGYDRTGSPADQPPPEPAAQQYAPQPAGPPPRRGRTWIWVVGIIAAALIAVTACCAVMFWSVAASGSSDGLGVGPAVAVIYIDAEIAGVGDGLSGGTITPESIISQLK